MKALISDIHGNLEALTAVFADIDAQGAEEVYFLGDVVGYGPNPEQCIDLVEKRCSVQLLGNHDQAILTMPIGFNPIAANAITCQRARMEPAIYSMPWKRRRWKFLGDLKQRHQDEELLFVHASPRDPVNEYILPTDPIYHQEKLEHTFTFVERLCFMGHTHFPGVFTADLNFRTPAKLDYCYEVGEEKALINIGSVGQPRDRDVRACYVLFDGQTVRYRRVEYDYNKTIEKVKKSNCLDDFCGLRLAEGR